jgi:transposase
MVSAGIENVKNVILDLSPTFRSFAEDFFPNARLIADKFHVVKLMHPLIHELRRKVIEDQKIEINGVDAGDIVNKTLSSVYELPYEISELEQQIKELKDFHL